MSGDSWNRLRSLFDQALEYEGDERRAFLDSACGNDSGLRQAVDSLLEADEEAGSFLRDPVVARDAGDSWPSQAPAPPDAKATLGPTLAAPAGQSPQSMTSTEMEMGELSRLGPYRILRRLGQGGMGIVYLAVRDDDSFQRRVVVKLVRRDLDDRDLLRRLRTERQILAGLDHANIARLYDGGATTDGRPYFVMEYIEGLPIDRYCDAHQLTLDERLQLFCKICSAVHYAHQNLVVHRDLKPSNILVDASGEPKLLDFGIAKLLNPELTAASELEPTATWHRMLTPQYASPEQVRGKLITTASDVYSLGVLLFKLLTGLHPFRLDNRSAMEIEQILTQQEPPRPSTVVVDLQDSDMPADERARKRNLLPQELAKQLSGDLDAIVTKALRAGPQQRYGSPERLAEDIERYRQGLPVEARQGTFQYRAGRLLRRRRVAFSVGAVISLLVLAFGWTLARQAGVVATERDQARLERQQKDTVLKLLLELLKVGDPYTGLGEQLTVREALEASREPLRRRLRDQPELLAELLHTTGVVYNNLGLWARARSDLEEALEIRLGILGEDHGDVAETRSALGVILAELGEETRSLELTRAALAAARRQAGDPELPWDESQGRLLHALDHHVTALCIASSYEEAAPLATEAVKLARKRPQTDVDELASALFNVASVELRTGREAQAAESFRQTLSLLEVLYGEDHLQLATPLNNLGSALRRSGNPEAAQEALERALKIVQSTVGDAHPSLAPMLNNLANLKLQRGDGHGAIENWSEVLELVRSKVGSGHSRVLFLELQIDRARASIGQGEAVLRDIERRMPAWVERLGADHRFVLFADRVRAEAFSALGRPEEAVALLEPLVETLRQTEFLTDLQAATDLLEELSTPVVESDPGANL